MDLHGELTWRGLVYDSTDGTREVLARLPLDDVPAAGAALRLGDRVVERMHETQDRVARGRDVDWEAQRIRVRNPYVRGEFSSQGKSDLSTRRSVTGTS